MRVVIRCDASVVLGTGHLMRSLTLARALREQGSEIAFICSELPGNCGDLINGQGFPVSWLPGIGRFDQVFDAERTASSPLFRSKSDWLIVDHYGIDAEWERHLRPQVGRIMVIDDLANRSHDCDILLDQNLSEGMLRRYVGLTPPACRQFLGPRYALLREEFIEARRTLRRRDGIVRSLLMFFGGSDPTNETEKALLAVKQLVYSDINVDVVVGSANPRASKIQDICSSMPKVTFHCQVANMASLMTHADLALGAGGSTTWERCFLGLPTLVVIVADNQAIPALAAENAGLVRTLGNSKDVTISELASAISQAIRQPEALKEMTYHCLGLMGHRNAPVNDEIFASLREVTDVP